MPEDKQKQAIKEAGHTPIMSYNQTDFVKDRVAVEVQFGKYAFVAHDLFVNHLSFYVSNIIDVGIEFLPMKELEKEMSSGVPYFERDLLNVIRQGERCSGCSAGIDRSLTVVKKKCCGRFDTTSHPVCVKHNSPLNFARN